MQAARLPHAEQARIIALAPLWLINAHKVMRYQCTVAVPKWPNVVIGDRLSESADDEMKISDIGRFQK